MFYTGIVEDVNDPLELGRARVRVVGLHVFDKVEIPTDGLPWANVMLPTTSPSADGAGITPRFTPFKTWVLIWFADGEDMQVPIIMGTIPGINNSTTLRINGEGGIYDERANPSPVWENQSDLPANARSGPVVNPRSRLSVTNDTGGFTQPESAAGGSRYPYNQVRRSESGHLEEWDDTPGSERLSQFHAAGTGYEISPDGSMERVVVGENFEVYYSGNNVYIEGVCNVHINNDANVYVDGNYTMNVKGNYQLNVKGNYTHHVKGDVESVYAGSEYKETSDHYHSVNGYYVKNITDEASVTANSFVVNSVGKLDLVSNDDITIGTTGDLITGANNISTTAEGTMALGTKSGSIGINSGQQTNITAGYGLYLSSTLSTNIGAGSAINIGTGSQPITMNGTQINHNNSGTSAPEVKALPPMTVSIPQIEVAEAEQPQVEFNEPTITALDPDLDVRRTQVGATSPEGYAAYSGTTSALAPNYTPNYNTNPNTTSRDVYQGGPLGGAAVGANISSSSSGFDALLTFIGSSEGNYNSINNGTQGNRIVGTDMNYQRNGVFLSEMTLGEILDSQRGTRANGRTMFAVGRYQIIPETMRNYCFPDSGLSRSDIFSPENQDKMGIALLIGRKRPALSAYLTGRSDDLYTAHLQFAMEWASIPHPGTGRSYYGGANRSGHTNEEVSAALQQARAEYLATNSGGLVS